jgi:hypothetical protein
MLQINHHNKLWLLVRDLPTGLELLDPVTCQTSVIPLPTFPVPETPRPQPQPVPGFLVFPSRPRDFLDSLRKSRTLLLTTFKTRKPQEPGLFGPVDVDEKKPRLKKQTKIERDMAALALKFGLSFTKKEV